MPEESFSIKDLGVTIAKMLGLAKGDEVELRRNKSDANQILVVRHPAEEQKPE
jgi:hypothetical protein